MPTLELNGTDLFYKVDGSGPLLLLIPGIVGHSRAYEATAKRLQSHYRVALYDRRGYSHSVTAGDQDMIRRLQVDVEDASALIAHLSSSGEPVLVFGSASGATIAMQLLISRPNLVQKIFVHEPLSFSTLEPENVRAMAANRVEHVYSIYRQSGVHAAVLVLSASLGAGADAAAMRAAFDPARGGNEVRANGLFFFEFELRQYPSTPIDIGLLAQHSDRVVPVVGVESGETPWAFGAKTMALKIGVEVRTVVGAHFGYITMPEEFGASLTELIGSSYN